MAEIQSTLDAIDAAVEQLCACGCGIKLDPAGDSMWFAGPACQARFHARDTTNPGEVWNRIDAAEAYDGGDHLRVPLNAPGVERRPLRRLPSGPLRNPLSISRRPEDYWPFETVTVPTDRVDYGHIAIYDETHRWLAEQAHERITRPIPPEWTVPDTSWVADWIAAHMPEMPPLEPFQRHLLSNMSFVYDTTPIRTFGEQLTEGFHVAGRSIRTFLDALGNLVVAGGNMYVRYRVEHRRNSTYRRAHRAGYTPPRDNPRVNALNVAYRRRQLARRRRNR